MNGKDVEAILQAYRRVELDISAAVKRRQTLLNIGGASASDEAGRLSAEIEKKMALKIDVERAWEVLDPMELEVIKARGVERRPWVQICWKVNYSRTWCFAIYRQALHKLASCGLLEKFKIQSESGPNDSRRV